MEFVYAVTCAQHLEAYQAFSERIRDRFGQFLHHLEQTCHVVDLPRCVVFANAKTATQLISNIPLPAYTNEFRTVFCPDIHTWRNIYLRQLDHAECSEIRHYYETKLTENHILQILGHEFVHHSELFIDEAYEKARWFEEGMCEYISRRYFLTAEEFQEEARINAILVRSFEHLHNPQALEDFQAETYNSSYTAIFYFYWKSFLAVNSIIQRFNGDILAVFREYSHWFNTAPSTPLSTWFQL